VTRRVLTSATRTPRSGIRSPSKKEEIRSPPRRSLVLTSGFTSLSGAPRPEKSSIARVMQNTFEGVWMYLGVDRFKAVTPEHFQPGIGLRPGG